MEKSPLNTSLKELSRLYPHLPELLCNRGQGSPSDRENFDRVAPYLTLGSALHQWGINEEMFLKELQVREEECEKEYDVKSAFPPFVALLPCGLRNPFSKIFDDFISQWGKKQDALVEGNVNHELSYYEYVDGIDRLEDLPDLMVTADINSLFHRRFQEKFVNLSAFMPAPKTVNPLFHRSDMVDPDGKYAFMATNLLVAVVDHDKLGDRPVPTRWEDLLDPSFERSVGVRGEEDFFCHSVSIPYYLLYGE
ncbi:MAG: ABC transporter substrate-binding protein, partial [Spirochaetales bacterium]|nr:ABC transporter substrate-binding protein [Spirochaetales bacterium]